MTILEARAPALPKWWTLPYAVLTSVAAYARGFSESFSDALRMAHEAQRRYPFCDW